METTNCLPKSCGKKIHHTNGPSVNNIKVTNANKEETLKRCEDDFKVEENNVETLVSQFKDISTSDAKDVEKVPAKSPNGYWTGLNHFENGIDKNIYAGGSRYYSNKKVKTSSKLVTDTDSQVLANRILGQDEDETSSTSTTTTTISTTSPESNADLENEFCASDANGVDVHQLNSKLELTKKEISKEIINKSGPFESVYVTSSLTKSIPLTVTVHDSFQLPPSASVSYSEARTSAMPSVSNSSYSLKSVNQSISHQSCPSLKTSVGGDLISTGLVQTTFSSPTREGDDDIRYEVYTSELQMGVIMKLIQKDLSEPYSIYTYRYFIHNWPKLCFLAMHGSQCVGAIVCKLDLHKKVIRRGYIAMLAVDERYRKRKIGSNLVLQAIQAMIVDDADEVVLETEISNKPALRLYENLGFVRDKRLFRYYLNGVDALRLKLWLH